MGSKVQRTLGTFHIRGPRSLALRWVAREVFWGDTELAPPPPQRSAGGGLPVWGAGVSRGIRGASTGSRALMPLSPQAGFPSFSVPPSPPTPRLPSLKGEVRTPWLIAEARGGGP